MGRDRTLGRLNQVERQFQKAEASGIHHKVNDGLSARLCYRNSLHLYRDGYVLAQRGDFGAGRSLLILSIEELAKAISYEMIYLGGFSTRRLDRGRLIWFDRKCFRCHRCKQDLVFKLNVGMQTMEILGTLQTWEKAINRAKTPSEAVKLLPSGIGSLLAFPTGQELLNSLRKRPGALDELRALFSAAIDMERAKQLGFYVEGWERPPVIPQAVTSDDFDRVREFVGPRLDQFFPILAKEVPKEWRRLTKAMGAGLSSALLTRDPNRRVPEIVCTHPARATSGAR